MLFGYFTLFVALTISAVAEFYSIVGLTAIFSAAFWPVVIMGACLGVGKVTAAVWLKLNWERASWTYKLYLVPAVAFLMVLTSMGIFGYLSKAHSDQSLVSGDTVAKIAVYDEKIKIAKDNIDANRKVLKQMDEAVDQVMARSTSETGADKAVTIRRSQSKERTRLVSEIAAEQKTISKLSEERAPIAAEVRKVEAEVGPIKYIAALIYGDDPDANLLEAAVRWVIIMIVAVFDPLALVLILAAQQSIRWAKEEKNAPKYEQDDGPLTQEQVGQLKESVDSSNDPHPPGWMFDPPTAEKSILEQHPYLNKPFAHFENLQPMVAQKEQPIETTVFVNPPDWGTTPIDNVERPGDYLVDSEKKAIRQWKMEHPADTIKHQRKLYNQGQIDKLPWEEKTIHSETFGQDFPEDPLRGNTHVLTAKIPHQVYKFNGDRWIAVDKGQTDSYTFNTAYVNHLIEKIESGEYDPDLLSDSEREQVTQQLSGRT
jgi:hypothetical protein